MDLETYYGNFLYHDSLFGGHPVLLNQHTTKLTISHPVFFVASDKSQAPFLIYPGDSIQVDYLLTDTIRMTRLGDGPTNEELNFFREIIKRHGSLDPFLEITPIRRRVANRKELELVEKDIHTLVQDRLLFLDDYYDAHSLDTDFYQLAQDYIRLAAVNDSISSYSINRSLVEREGLLAPFLERMPKKIVEQYGFQSYLPWYKAYGNIVYLGVAYRGVTTEEIFHKKNTFINHAFEGKVKDFLLSKSFNMALNKLKVSDADWEQLDDWLGDEVYRQIMANKRAHGENMARFSDTDMLVSVDAKDTLSSAILLDQLQGNVVLLDFWASWCVPCRKEFPASKSLLAELQGEPFKTVYLSVDDDFGAWQKAVQDEGLGDAKNYYILGRKESSLVNTFSVGPIPRYILLDKEGEVISRDAPRPSDTELKKMIEAHL